MSAVFLTHRKYKIWAKSAIAVAGRIHCRRSYWQSHMSKNEIFILNILHVLEESDMDEIIDDYKYDCDDKVKVLDHDGLIFETNSYRGTGVAYNTIESHHKHRESKHWKETYTIDVLSPLHDHQSFCGIYNGHTDRQAVEFVTGNLRKNVFDMMKKYSSSGGRYKEEAVKAGYLKTNEDYLRLVMPIISTYIFVSS